MTFRLDCTAESSVVVCVQCGWRSLAFTRTGAWRLARTHEQRAHPGQLSAAQGLADATRRQGP